MGTQTQHPDQVPVMQRLYDRIWLLAIAAILFFTLSYVAWGWWETISVPGVIG